MARYIITCFAMLVASLTIGLTPAAFASSEPKRDIFVRSLARDHTVISFRKGSGATITEACRLGAWSTPDGDPITTDACIDHALIGQCTQWKKEYSDGWPYRSTDCSSRESIREMLKRSHFVNDGTNEPTVEVSSFPRLTVNNDLWDEFIGTREPNTKAIDTAKPDAAIKPPSADVTSIEDDRQLSEMRVQITELKQKNITFDRELREAHERINELERIGSTPRPTGAGIHDHQQIVEEHVNPESASRGWHGLGLPLWLWIVIFTIALLLVGALTLRYVQKQNRFPEKNAKIAALQKQLEERNERIQHLEQTVTTAETHANRHKTYRRWAVLLAREARVRRYETSPLSTERDRLQAEVNKLADANCGLQSRIGELKDQLREFTPGAVVLVQIPGSGLKIPLQISEVPRKFTSPLKKDPVLPETIFAHLADEPEKIKELEWPENVQWDYEKVKDAIISTVKDRS